MLWVFKKFHMRKLNSLPWFKFENPEFQMLLLFEKQKMQICQISHLRHPTAPNMSFTHKFREDTNNGGMYPEREEAVGNIICQISLLHNIVNKYLINL